MQAATLRTRRLQLLRTRGCNPPHQRLQPSAPEGCSSYARGASKCAARLLRHAALRGDALDGHLGLGQQGESLRQGESRREVWRESGRRPRALWWACWALWWARGSGAARAAGQQGGGVAGRRGAKGGGAPRAAGRDGRAARASRIRFSSSTAYPGLEVSAGSLAAACLSTSCMASSRALSVFSREYRISLD